MSSHFTDGSDCLVNLEFDELNALNTDEITILDEISGQNVQVKEITDDFKVDLESIKSIKEEIEQLDVNLGRYNVRNESEEFLKKIYDFDDDKDILTKSKQVGQKQPTKSMPFRGDSKIKKIFKKNKRLCIVVISFIICLFIIGIASGLIFGLKK